MANACPSKTHPFYNAVLNKVGGDELALYRLFSMYNATNPGEELEAIMDAYNPAKNPISARIAQIRKAAGTLKRDDATHRYYFPENPSLEIVSVTTAIDEISELSYRGSREKQGYADTGTGVHTVFQFVGEKVSEQTILKKMDELGIPKELYSSIKSKMDDFKSDGSTLLIEPFLYSGNIDGRLIPIAGASDIIRFRPDGTYQIIDIKTANLTPKVRQKIAQGKQKGIWDPTVDNNFKAKRYSTQLMAYGRLLEMSLGIAPSDYLIIPVELETENDSPDGKIVAARVLNTENLKDAPYNYYQYVSKNLDSIFKQRSFQPAAQGTVEYKDVVGSIYTKLTGDAANTANVGNHRDLADNIWKRQEKQGKVKGFYVQGNRFIPYKNPNDYNSQINQIIDDYLAKNINVDMENSIVNFLSEKDEKIAQSYLNNLGSGAAKLIDFLSPFQGRTDIEVTSLSTIPGFEDKSNWILIKEKFAADSKNPITHLLYVGQENLDATFVTKNPGGIVSPIEFTGKTVFGKYIGTAESDAEIQTSLKNRLGDARSLEATMIAMRLKAENPDIKFGIMSLFGMNSSENAFVVDLKENLRTLSRAVQNDTLRRELFTSSFLELSSQERIFEYENYQANWLDSLMHSVDANLRLSTFDKNAIISSIKNYADDVTKKNELIDTLRTIIINKMKMGSDISTDYNMSILARVYLQLKAINVSVIPSNTFAVNVGIPPALKNSMLQEAQRVEQTAQTKMYNSFWDEYKTEYSVSLKSFFNSKGIGTAPKDYLLGDTPRHYTNLFKKMKVNVQTTEGLEEREVTLFEFKSEESDEFKALTKEEQNLIVATNDMIQKLAKLDNIEWTRGTLPLVRASLANKIFNTSRSKIGQYTGLIRDFLYDLESSFGAGEDAKPTLANIFASQGKPENESDKNSKIGLHISEDGVATLDEERYRQWSTNIESMMDVFAIQALKHRYMNDVSATMRAMNYINNWYKSNLVGERIDSNINFLNWFHAVNVAGTDLDKPGIEQTVGKATRAISRLASTYYLGLDPIVAAVSTLGNELTLFSQAIANGFSKSSGIKPASYAKAKGILSKALGGYAVSQKEFDKITKLMERFRLFNNDAGQLLSGFHRVGDKFIFRGRYLFGLLSAGEWHSRASFMIGQMIDDGTWDSISLDDTGNLVYDETKDSRFNGKGNLKPEEAKALKKVLLQNLAQKEGESLQFPYDENMGTSIRTTINYLYGGMDRNVKSAFNFKWWGRLFISHKNWLPAKVQRWTMSPTESALIGKWKFQTNPETGETIPVWTGEQMEGILFSLAAGINYLNKVAKGAETKPLTQFQKNNIIRFTGDLALVLLSMLLYMSIPDDDDETKLDDAFALIIKRAMDDLLVFYNVLSIDEYLYTPVPLKFLTLTSNNVFKIFSGGPTAEEVLRLFPVTESIRQTAEQFDYEFEQADEQEEFE